MTNDELLIAISDMMDQKLDISLKPLKNDVADLKADVAKLKTDVAELKTDVAELKTDVAGLKTDVAELKADVAKLKTDVAELKTDVAELKTHVAVLETRVTKIQITQENDILPRLQNIETCYIDTYKRYQHDADRMETAFEDIRMLKIVVAEHSEKLKNVS